MKKYLVKVTSVATKENKNFAGETAIYYHGKSHRTLGAEGSHNDRWGLSVPLWGVRKYGYDRVCDAKRNYSYKNPENSENWKSVAEIVEVEC